MCVFVGAWTGSDMGSEGALELADGEATAPNERWNWRVASPRHAVALRCRSKTAGLHISIGKSEVPLQNGGASQINAHIGHNTYMYNLICQWSRFYSYKKLDPSYYPQITTTLIKICRYVRSSQLKMQ